MPIYILILDEWEQFLIWSMALEIIIILYFCQSNKQNGILLF